jgi:hypothetical protein
MPELSAGKISIKFGAKAARSISALTDPGYEVDLFILTDLRTMTAVWMGDAKLKQGWDRVSSKCTDRASSAPSLARGSA